MADDRILLLEDDYDLGFLLVHALRSEGFVVDLATTVAHALGQLRGQRYALVIADWRLPDGDGMAVADAASALGAKTIVISGRLFQMPGARAGAHDLLMKPVRPSEIVELVARALGRSTSC